MEQLPKSVPPDARIAIVGAGPAGLATAWFLKEHGFVNVTVFERYGRVGGLCFTMNDGYRAFDLGGNYVTPAYRETRKIAREVGATTYRCHPYIGWRMDEHGGEPRYVEMTQVVREIRDADGNPIGMVSWLAFAWAILRYVFARWRVRGAIDRPDFARVHERPELCVTFGEWLGAHKLEQLRSLFEIPITMMGYGYLDEIAAPYALKYMTLRTFIPMCLRQVWFVGWLFPWPRRFTYGFQRMWEAVSWRLNIRSDVEIADIWRLGDPPPEKGEAPTAENPIRMDLCYPERIFKHDVRREFTRWFDHLIVASSRVGSLAQALHMEPDGLEHRLIFENVRTFGFCMTTFHPRKPSGEEFRLERPVVCVLPFRKQGDEERPWIVVQLWPDDTPMLQCYTRLQVVDDNVSRRDAVIEGAKALVRRMGAIRVGDRDPHQCRWEHYEQWPYFGHVSAKEIAGGFFAKLEGLQGYRNTYRVGGFTNFELIEPIVCYAKALVEKHFAGIGPAR